MPTSAPAFAIKRAISGTYAAGHNAQIAEVLGLFDTVLLTFWDNDGFIHRTKVKKGILKAEDARIRLFVVGTLSSGVTMTATIEVRFDLPVDVYRTYKEVPITTWDLIRGNLVTYLGTQSITAVDGVLL